MAMTERQSRVALDLGMETQCVLRRVTCPESEGGYAIVGEEVVHLASVIEQWFVQTREVDATDELCEHIRRRGASAGLNPPMLARMRDYAQLSPAPVPTPISARTSRRAACKRGR